MDLGVKHQCQNDNTQNSHRKNTPPPQPQKSVAFSPATAGKTPLAECIFVVSDHRGNIKY